MKKDRSFPLRISEEDEALVDLIQSKTGTGSKADVWRQALRAYAEKLKLKLPAAFGRK